MDARASHQTVRLSAGRHAAPDDGACVMELASMLGGEPFSDHPRSVSPTIGAFLRAYNDALDDVRRQDLYPLAAAVVGSIADDRRERARQAVCAQWVSRLPRGRLQLRFSRPAPARATIDTAVTAGRRAGQLVAHRDDARLHARALAFVEELIGCPEAPAVEPAAPLEAVAG